jgi:DNA-directed RNA polymerase specialized sigma24 family protein
MRDAVTSGRGRLVAGRPASGSDSPQRAVLTLRVPGHSYRETAARLGISERTVERQLLRARRAVRRAKADTDAGPLAA